MPLFLQLNLLFFILGLSSSVLDSKASDAALVITASHVIGVYPLLMAELGIRSVDVTHILVNNPRDIMNSIYSMLLLSRANVGERFTLRLLLVVIEHLGISTHNLQSELINVHRLR